MQLLIYFIILIISELLKKPVKQADIAPTSFSDFGFPSVDPNNRVPVIHGTVRLDSPQCLDVLEYRATAIRQTINYSMFSSKQDTIGYRYYAGLHLGLCKGDATCALRKIYFDDKLVWSGTAVANDAGHTITIDLPKFYGGKDENGGVGGTVRFWAGTPTQGMDPYVGAHQSPSSAYRFCASVVFQDFYWGNGGSLPKIAFEVERFPNTLGLGATRIMSTTLGESPQTAYDLNIAEILYECITNQEWGLHDNFAAVNTASFITAAATLLPEGNGASLKWVQGDNLEAVMRELVKQVDGVLYKKSATDQWFLKLARADYLANSPVTTYVLTKDNCKMVSFTRGTWDETYNQVQIGWTDRYSTQNPPPAMEQDIANFDIQGTYAVATNNYPGVYSAQLAQRIAARDMFQLGAPLALLEVVCQRNVYDINPGDVFRWSNSDLQITQIFMRALKVTEGEQGQSEIRINAVQDIFGLGQTMFSRPPGSAYAPINTQNAEVTTAKVADQPYIINYLDPDAGTPGATHKPLIVARVPQSSSEQYRIWEREGAAGFEAQQFGDFAPNGVLISPLAVDASPVDSPDIIVGTASLMGELETATKLQIQSEGRNLALIDEPGSSPIKEPELIAYDSVTDNGNGTYTLVNAWRGLGDTQPQPWGSGARVWFLSQFVSSTVKNAYLAAATLDIRMTEIAPVGETDVSTATTRSVTFRNRINRPYPPGAFAINGQRYPTTALGAGNITFTWAHRSRLSNQLRYQNDVGQTLDAGTEYFLKIYRTAGNVLLRTVGTGATGGINNDTTPLTAATYVYTTVLQNADNSPIPTGLRVELYVRVVGSSPMLTSLLAVKRTFTR